MLDIQIPGITLPRINQFNTGKVFFTNYWITKSGLTRIILSNRDEIVKLIIPTPWDVISAFADAAGYRIENSDKGSIGNELVRLIGGIKNIWIISSPVIIDLLLEMSNVNKLNEIKKLIRDNVQDDEIKNQLINSLPRKTLSKKTMSFPAIKSKLKTEKDSKKLDDKSIKFIIEWLLDKGIFRQGKMITCKNCLSDNWIPVNKFDSKIVCNGCMNEIKNPFSTDKIEWDYEINTLVSAEIDQGLLVHLLTGYYIFDETISNDPKGSIYGSYYGLKFIGNNREKEMDIVFIVDGQLIIGECKVSGRGLSDQDIQDYITFAKEVKASKVIISCFEHIEELESKIQNIPRNNIEVKILGKDELFNQSPGLSFAKQLHEKKNNESPVNRSAVYVQSLKGLIEA